MSPKPCFALAVLVLLLALAMGNPFLGRRSSASLPAAPIPGLDHVVVPEGGRLAEGGMQFAADSIPVVGSTQDGVLVQPRDAVAPAPASGQLPEHAPDEELPAPVIR